MSNILERVLLKTPPISNAENASDKGFKDTVIWLSLLNYFKYKEENEIVFLTNDKGFLNNSKYLIEEFLEHTGKVIDIKSNSYYKDLISANAENQKENSHYKKIQNISSLCDKISTTIESLCEFDTYDYWGNPDWSKTFRIKTKFNMADIELTFENLENNLQSHIFEKYLYPSEIFITEINIENIGKIAIESLENLLSLYDEIKHDYPNYIEQFYTTALNIFNQNYYEDLDTDDELPF